MDSIGATAPAEDAGDQVEAVAQEWLDIQRDLGRAPRTVEAYRRCLRDYLSFCTREKVPPLRAGRAEIARYIRDLRERPGPRGAKVVSLDSGVGLANATIQQRLTAVRLFYDYLIEEQRRDDNPVGLVPRLSTLPWIPTDAQWRAILAAARPAPIRNRLMLALGYDAGLRREELCSLRTDDLDPARRTLRIRAETTKTRRERVVLYSAATGELLRAYLAHRRMLSSARGPLFLSESRRNPAAPLSLWSWSKIVRQLAVAADVPRFSTHTLRHLCLTDLARAGWELHAIAQFAGHRNLTTTLQYVHLSGRDLAAKLARGVSSED